MLFFCNCINNSFVNLLLFIVIRWCRSCVDLFIMVGNEKFEYQRFRGPSLDDSWFKSIFDTALDLLSSHVIDWMRNLKSLVVLSYDSQIHLERCVLDRILSWLPEQNYQLEKLWLTADGIIDNYSEEVMTGSSSPVKSFVLGENPSFEYENLLLLNGERFLQLEHLSGFPFRRFDYLPNLKYFRGVCDTGDDEVI